VDFVDSDASKFRYRFYRLRQNGTYSANVIGYATVTLPPKLSAIANPFEGADSRVAALFKGMPDGAALSRYDPQAHRLTTNTVEGGKWSNPEERFVLGEGAVFFNPTSDYKELSFVGEVLPGSISSPIPAGCSLRSALIPQPGRLHTDLGFPIDEGDVVHLFDTEQQKYVLYPYDEAVWETNPPILGVGESFWIEKNSARNWVRNFSVA
jgi:hypothetical protein